MSKKVLILGTYHSEGVDSFDWFQELPNVSEYDIVILDTTKIFNFWSLAGRVEHVGENVYLLSDVNETDKRIRSNISLVRDKLLEMLWFDVTVYALYSPNIGVFTPVDRGRIIFVHINDWCPISIRTVVEKGKIILVKDGSYKEYFIDFKNWEYYFDPDSLDISNLQYFYHSKWAVTHELNIIATSKVDKPIALEFYPCFHRWAPDEEAEEAFVSKIEHVGGSLVLLPVADRYATSPYIEILLQRDRQFEETPPPSWVNNIEIPREASRRRELSKGNEKLRKAEADVKNLEASLHQIQKYKRLLYDTGLSLQDISKSTLEELGARTKPSISTDEFIIEVGNKEALIEVKGNTKSVKKDDIAQLIIDLGQHFKDTGKDIKGILIGNAWRLLPLEDRDISGKPIFTKQVIQAAENHDIGLISTVELFKAYCKLLEQPECTSEILDKIINSKGIIRF